MDALHTQDDDTDATTSAEVEAQRQDASTHDLPGVAVVHRARLATGVAVAAAAMTVAWFARALQTGEHRRLAVVRRAGRGRHRAAARRPRQPGAAAARRRPGRAGTTRRDLDRAALAGHRPRRGAVTCLLAARRQDRRAPPRARTTPPSRPSRRSTFTVPLAATTRIEYDGLTGDLVADLDALASGRTPVLVLTRIEPTPPRTSSTRSRRRTRRGRAGDRRGRAGARAGAARGRPLRGRGRRARCSRLGRRPGAAPPDDSRGARRGRRGRAGRRGSPRPRAAPEKAPAPQVHFRPVEPVRGTLPAARSESVHESTPKHAPPPDRRGRAGRAAGPAAGPAGRRSWWPGSTTSRCIVPAPRPRRRSGRSIAAARQPGPAEHRHPERAHPDPPARAGVHRGRRLRALRWRLLRARSPPHARAGLRPRRPGAAGDLRRALRQPRDRGPPGLRGRARHRHRRRHARHLRGPAMEHPRGQRRRARDGVGRRALLHRHAAGDRQPRAERRLGRPDPRQAGARSQVHAGRARRHRCGGQPAGRRTRPGRADPLGRQARGRQAPAGDRPGALRRDRQQRQGGQGHLPRQGRRGR